MIVDNHQYNSPLRPNQHRSGLSYYEKILFFLGSLFVVVGILTLLEFKFKIIAQFTSESNEVNENVLAAHDLVPYTQFQSNLRYVLNNSAEVLNGLTISGDIEADGSNLNLGEGEITASNVMYGITAGEGITITGGQNPIISLSVPLEPTTGVSSIEDLSGAIDLEAGGNISISKDGNKLTISGSSVSDTNTTYSAGIGLELNGTTFNVDFNGIGLQDTASSAASGASIIGVYTGGFTNITTTTPGASLQTVLETIDSELSIMGGGGITAVGNISSGNAFTSGTPGSNLFIADTGWIGLGSGAGRIMWSDDTTDEISVLGARLGVGLLNPSYELDVAGNIRAGTDIYIGSTALTSTGGASALGVDSSSIIYSSGSNIQQVLEDLDTAINNFGVGGSGVWLDGGSYAYLNPALTTYLGNNASGGSNKLNGAYFSDNSLLSLGTDNDFRMLFNGTNLILGDTSNTFLSIGDSGTTGNFDFNNGQFYIRGDGNVGIGTTNVTSKLSINGGNIKHTASNTPPIIGSYDSNGWATGIYVNGKYAYLADETEGLKIIDINNPVSPNLVGSSTTPGTAEDVQVVGRYAYVADGHSGMTIIDVSNPDTPFIVSVTDTPDIVHNLYISGKYAYLASYSAGLYIVDVSNPYSPVVVGSYDSSGTAHDVFVVGKYAYLADYAAGLRIINISDPTNPTLSGTVDTSGSVNAVYVSGRYAYISDWTGDFKVIDVADPTNPTQVSSLSLDGSGNGIFMTGKYVYFSSYDGIFIIDVSDPANPEVVGSNTSLFNPFNIYVAGKYAYVGDAGAGLVILDINGIETPAIYAGNIQGNDLKVTEDAEIVNNLYVGNGLNVGMGGALIGGNLSIGASYDLSIGNIRLGGTGGAGLIGVNTSGFGVSTAPTVQGQLAALNAAVSSMSSPWTDAGTFLMPAAGEYLGNMAVGSTGKLAGAYFADNSLLSFGTDNDFRMTFNGTNFLLGDTSNTFLSIGDSGTTGNFNFNNGQVYIRGDGNVGIGTTAPAYTLDVDGVARSTSLLTDALVLSSSAGNMLTAQGGFNAYTQFSGGVGTGGIDSITPAQRITSSGNLTNIGSIQAGEMLLTSGGTFGEAVNYTTAANARHVAIGEFNGDKHPDLVAVNYTASGSASVFINNGDGTFATRVDYATDFLPANVATGDVNGDGYTDIVTVNAAHSVSVLLNNGDGTFATRVNYAVGSTPYTLSLGDFDGDGKLDIATANQDADTVSILLNNGDGTFATKVDYGSADAPRAIGVGDANGDNKLDVFVTSNIDDVVSVLLNNGDGTFATKVDYTTDENPQGIAIGDINDDGAVDIATANNSGTISILLNNGDGTFDTKVDYGSSGAYRAISLGDINGDGKPDISTASYVDDFVSVLMNNGDGTFATSVEYDTGANPWGVALGDLNNDGKADMIVSNSQAQSISVYINETSTMFYAQASTGRIGIGTTAPQYSLDVTGNIRAGTDIYIGSIGLGGTGGAGLIGVNTSGFGVSTAPTVQGQLAALNAAIAGLGASPWTDAGSYLRPTSNEFLGNIAVGGTGKLSGLYLADNALSVFGTDNDFGMLFNGTNFILGDTSNTFLSIGDSGTTANFAFNTNDLFIRGDGRVGIGTVSPQALLDVRGDIFTDRYANQSSNTLLGIGVAGVGNLSGQYNTLIGGLAFNSISSGASNTGLGYQAGYSTTTGSHNITIGQQALLWNQTGQRNVAIGSIAGYSNMTHSISNNVLIGYGTGFSLVSGGNNNTLLGYGAGDNITSGSGNIILGYNIDAPSATEHNQINIGNLIYGRNGNFGINDNNPGSKLSIAGLGSNTGTAMVIDANGDVWRDSSSLRYKDDISALVGPFDKIYELDPVKYRFKGTDSYTIGYVAEDLHALGLTDLVIYDNEGRPDAIKYDRLSLYNLELLKEQKLDIDGISSVLSASETSFNAQDTRILGIQDELTEYKAELDSLQDQIDELFDIVHNSNKVATEEASVAKLTDRVSFLEQMLFGTEASDEASLSQFKVNTGEYPDGEVLSIEDGKLTVEDLTVTGKTNLYDLGVIGDMSVGQLVVRGREATINSLALPLQIQSQATAEIQLMAGKVVIDTDGNLTVQEEITAKKYNIDTSNDEESSAGSVVIKKGEVEIEIETTSLTESSLIFTSPKKIAVPVATEVIGKNKFLLKLDKKLTEDLEVSWWIVN